MTTIAPPDLDKLRNIVQKFGASSFTTAAVAREYSEDAPSDEDVTLLEAQLQRHAPVLGIQALPAQAPASTAHAHTLWRAL